MRRMCLLAFRRHNHRAHLGGSHCLWGLLLWAEGHCREIKKNAAMPTVGLLFASWLKRLRLLHYSLLSSATVTTITWKRKTPFWGEGSARACAFESICPVEVTTRCCYVPPLAVNSRVWDAKRAWQTFVLAIIEQTFAVSVRTRWGPLYGSRTVNIPNAWCSCLSLQTS